MSQALLYQPTCVTSSQTTSEIWTDLSSDTVEAASPVLYDREVDGRWIAEFPALPGVMVYGSTRLDALIRLRALLREVVAELRENNEPVPVGALTLL